MEYVEKHFLEQEQFWCNLVPCMGQCLLWVIVCNGFSQ